MKKRGEQVGHAGGSRGPGVGGVRLLEAGKYLFVLVKLCVRKRLF